MYACLIAESAHKFSILLLKPSYKSPILVSETRSARALLLLCFVWRHMERTEKLKELFQPVFDEFGVRLYELKWIGGRDRTLQVAIMKEDGSMDLDTCADVSERLSEVLDASDPISEEYTLEVCSPGAEREIKDLSELDHLIGSYIHVRLSVPFKKMTEITGELVSVEDNQVTVSYRDKAAVRKAVLNREDIEYARMAVRI